MSWEKIDGDYPDLEDNINPFTQEVQGQRIFPGKKTPSDTLRNKVTLKVDVGIPNAQVYVKAFDVDDPTPTDDDEKDNGTYLIDPNDSNTVGVGNDNREDHVIPSGKEAGFFTSSNTATANKQSDAEGIAEFEFNVGMQPGNNYRVVASVFNEDVYANVQVTDPSANGYLGPDEDDTPTPASPLLTVWRKLHLEVDSMEAPPEKTQRESPDNITKTGVSWALNTPVSSQSTLTVDGTLEEDADFYAAGEIISGSTSFRIISNTDNLISDDQIVIEGVPPGTEQALFIGQSFEIVDDDDWQVSDIGLPVPLPKHDSSGSIAAAIQTKYSTSFIKIVDAVDLNLNPNKTIPFTSNAAAATLGGFSVFDDSLDLASEDERDFWAFGLVFGYQPESGKDNDPLESLLRGGTPEVLLGNIPYGFSVVYVESIREKVIGEDPPLPDAIKIIRKQEYEDWLHGTAAHEIGHAPGRNNESSDHSEEGLMEAAGGNFSTDFKPVTIKRFRSAKSWRE